MGWVRKHTGWDWFTSENLTKAALAVGAIYTGGAALGAWGAGGAAAGAGAGSAAAAGVGAGATGAGALGSGMFGAIGPSATSFGLGATSSALGAGLGTGLGAAGAAGAGASALGYGLGGSIMAGAAGTLSSAGLGSTIAGGASGALGSGFFGSGVMDIGAAMGTTGGGAFGLGSGLAGVGDLGSIVAGNFLGDWGAASTIPETVGGIGESFMNTQKFPLKTKQIGQAAKPELTTEEKVVNALKKQGAKAVARSILGGSPSQPQYIQSNIPPPVPEAPPVSSQRRGALSQVNRQNSPLDVHNVAVAQDLQREMRDRRYSPRRNLQSGNNTGTLEGYELWKALESQRQ